VIGIDPGTALMGYGIVEGEGNRQRAVAYGALTTPPGTAAELRLQRLYRELSALMEQHAPDVLAVEELFFGRNVTTAIFVGQARGVVLLAAADHGVPVREFTPAQVKQGVTGYGRAEKLQVQQMVKVLLNLPAPPQPDDVADALAVGICALQSARFDAGTGGVRKG
jgi:crossover junction endodeoxyribonuclease RuvC